MPWTFIRQLWTKNDENKERERKETIKNIEERKEKTTMKIVERKEYQYWAQEQLSTILTTEKEGENTDVETEGRSAANPHTDRKIHNNTANFLLHLSTELEKASDIQKNQKKVKLEQERKKTNRCGTKIVMEERKYIHDSYLEVTDIPYHLMRNLILFFLISTLIKGIIKNFQYLLLVTRMLQNLIKDHILDIWWEERK